LSAIVCAQQIACLHLQVTAKAAYVDERDYVGLYEQAIECVREDTGTALLLAFDIDDTLAKSSGTGDRKLLPDGVLQALESIKGAGNKMFVMAATGRIPEDAQVSFGDFKLPLVARDGSCIRYPDQQVREV
jgi:trehalose-6-phosphatase